MAYSPMVTRCAGAVAVDAAHVGDDVSRIAAVEGPPMTVGFNVKYIADVLGVIHSGQVALELNGPAGPGVVKPLDGSDLLHVMMPINIPR